MSAGTVDFIVGVDKKLWVGSGLFKNFKSFFGTQGAVFCSKRFDHTDWIALPDYAAGYSFTLVGWGGIGFTELSCKMLGFVLGQSDPHIFVVSGGFESIGM